MNKKEYKCEQCPNWYLWEHNNYSKWRKKLCPSCKVNNYKANQRKRYETTN